VRARSRPCSPGARVGNREIRLFDKAVRRFDVLPVADFSLCARSRRAAVGLQDEAWDSNERHWDRAGVARRFCAALELREQFRGRMDTSREAWNYEVVVRRICRRRVPTGRRVRSGGRALAGQAESGGIGEAERHNLGQTRSCRALARLGVWWVHSLPPRAPRLLDDDELCVFH